MNTPICDFVSEYIKKNTIRLHMPGHKGKGNLSVENRDITEIKGADSLFEADSVIKESEDNASALFGCPTYYSAEGSSLCIRAMVYLVSLYAKAKGKAPLMLAARNVHKTFISVVALCDMDVEWMCGGNSYLSCSISADELDSKLSQMATKPAAFYITSPDYLGNIADIKALSQVCKKHDVLLLVDNAHGAYLKFSGDVQHPVDLGADLCCDSAHKTLPVLTGGAYLHINKDAQALFCDKVKFAMSLFASTSPSYLIMQSLDLANKYIADGYKEKLADFVLKVAKIKAKLTDNGYTFVGDEILKITVSTKPYGYLGDNFAEILRGKNIECEFSDPDFVVFMLTPESADDVDKLCGAMLEIEKKPAIYEEPPQILPLKKAMSIHDAIFSNAENVSIKDSIGRVCASTSVSCPPAVPIVVCGEVIDQSAVKCFEYYSIDKCAVVKV